MGLVMYLGRIGETGTRAEIFTRPMQFVAAFDAVFQNAGIRTLLSPMRAPRANAITDR
jgi:hypothetical protein